MTIKFLYGAMAGAFHSAVMAEALISGCSLTIYHPFVSIEVGDWDSFLHIVWRACADCSRDSRGQLIGKAMEVSVGYKDSLYHTRVWYDFDNGGLRYVSLL